MQAVMGMLDSITPNTTAAQIEGIRNQIQPGELEYITQQSAPNILKQFFGSQKAKEYARLKENSDRIRLGKDDMTPEQRQEDVKRRMRASRIGIAPGF